MNFIVEDENGREVTVWTSDNFTPGNYLPLAGGTLSGILKVKSKLFVSELPGFQDVNPSINLAIGDSDTGFHSIGDGELVFYSNGRVIYNMKSVWHTGNFNPNDKLNVSGGTINGNLSVSGSFSSNTLSANSGTITNATVSTLNISGEAIWAKNTDYFKVGFKNDADGDSDSYGYIRVGDNGNEYFKVISVNGNAETDWLVVNGDGLFHKGHKAWTAATFNPDNKSNTNHNHDSVYAKIHSHPYASDTHTHDATYVKDVRYTGMVMRKQGERNDQQSVEFGSGILVTAATYGEGPNVCTQNTRQLQILRNGSWLTIGY